MFYPTIIGIDTHARSNTMFAIDRESGAFKRAKMSSEHEDTLKHVRALNMPEPYLVVYESGPTGFGLARYLNDEGIKCEVCATSKMPKDISQNKNDKRDAEAIARQAIAGTLRFVYIPTPHEQTLRDLSHHYAQCSKAVTAAKQRVSSFMLAHNIRYKKGCKLWTKTFLRWAEELAFEDKADAFIFHDKVAEARRLIERKEAVLALIEQLAATDAQLGQDMSRLQCVSGIGTVISFALVSEVNDFERFSNGAAFASYVGLVPSEDSSGEKRSTGRITKQGNSHLRRMLVEAMSPSRRKGSPPAKVCGQTVDPHIRAMAARCDERLAKRRADMKRRCKSPNKAKVALARELAEWVYYIMTAK
jgi:transposase